MRAVGTQSLRQARNSNEFLLEAQHALGFPIEVISGREEARLVFEGCMHTLPPSNSAALVVDIGGASTEVIVGEGFEAENAESFRVGCVNASLRFFRDGRIDRLASKKRRSPQRPKSKRRSRIFAQALGRGVRIERHDRCSVATSCERRRLDRRHDHERRLADAAICVAGCRRNQAIRVGRHESRNGRKCSAGGVAVLSGSLRDAWHHEMRTARGALRVGVLYDLLGRRERKRLARRKRVTACRRASPSTGRKRNASAHAAQLLFELLSRTRRARDGKHLAWAALLHEVGFCDFPQRLSQARRLPDRSTATSRDFRHRPGAGGRTR